MSSSVHSSTASGIHTHAPHTTTTTDTSSKANSGTRNQETQQQQLQSQVRNHFRIFHSVTEEFRALPEDGVPVDEILPASMLRFAATANKKASHILAALSKELNHADSNDNLSALSLAPQMDLVEAQLIIVQHLCCVYHNHSAVYQYDREFLHLQQWNIPGAHESVGLILSHSLTLVCTGRSANDKGDYLLSFVVHADVHDGDDNESPTSDDSAANGDNNNKKTTILPPASKDQWKHILLVTRATTDLLSSGWRPLPRGKEGADAVLALLVIASRGTKLDDLTSAQETTSMESCEERLLASSCAAEAFSALLFMANRGWIPFEHQNTLVRTVCRLKGMLRATMEATGSNSNLLYPLAPVGNDGLPSPLPIRSSSGKDAEEREHQVEFFSSQRELCLTDASDLLWAMLSHEASLETSIEVMFCIVETATQALGDDQDNAESHLFNKLKWNDQTDDYALADCATVVCVLSSALWGTDFTEIAMLRIFWHSAIESISKILSTIHFKFATPEEDARNRAGGTSFLIRSNYFTKRVCPLLVDAITALEKAIEVELRGGSGVLSSLEWEAIVDGIENAVLPWLECSSQASTISATTDQIRIEAESLLLRVADLLAYYVRSEGFSLMDYSCLRRLLMLLLRGSALFDEAKAEQIEIAAMHAWSKFGFFPYRLEGWRETVTELLQEAFSRNTEGKFLHSSPARLGALESLTFEEANKETTLSDADFLKPQSLLFVIQHMRELYSEIVVESFLPILKLILVQSISTCSPVDLRDSEPDEIHRVQKTSKETNDLELYAVELTGRLFLSVSADHSVRIELVPMLKCAALFGPPSGASSDVSVQVEGSRQLYLCLRGIFCDLPTAHKNIPLIVDAVCEIFKTTINRLVEDKDDDHFEETGAVCFGALRTLGRLQLYSKNRLAFHYDTAPKEAVDTDTSHFHSEKNCNHGRARQVAVSSFVRVGKDNVENSTSSDHTHFSFQPITKELLFALAKTSQKASGENKPKELLFASIRRSCLDVLSSLLIEGVTMETQAESVENTFCARIFDAGAASSTDQMVAMVRALSRATQSVLTSPEKSCGISSCRLLDLLAEPIKSSAAPVVNAICSALFAIVFSVENAGEAIAINKIYRVLQDRLEIEQGQINGAGENARLVGSLLSVLTEAVSTWVHPANATNVMRTFESCLNIVSKTYLQSKSVPLHTALRGALQIIQKFTPEEARSGGQMFSVIYDDYFKRFGAESNGSYAETNFAPVILKEALDHQSQVPSEEEMCTSKSLSCMSKHQRLTAVSEQMDRFTVEAEGTGVRPSCVAWLCHDSVVLTCRVGSPSSRYRGHVEVILRSPTIRIRTLIPIPGKVALEDPEFPSPLFDAHRSDVPDPTQEDQRKDLGHYKMKSSSSDILDHAESLIDRFDAMFSNEGDTEDPPQSELGDESYSSESTRDDDDLSAPGSALTDTTGTTTILSLPEPSKEASSINASNPDDASIASVVEELGEQGVFDWFITTFGWEAEESDLQARLDECLLSHGLSISSGDAHSAFQNYKFGDSKQLFYDSKLERAIAILDRTATCDTYKFGLLYFRQPVQPANANETASSEVLLLSTSHCSPAFHKFASRLGSMTPIRHLKYYSAGLDVSEYESDGRYTIAWLAPDKTSSVVFHVVNLMPAKFNGRKRHIGNDNVLIIFVEETSDTEQLIPSQRGETATYGAPVVSGQFDFATIFVKQLPRPGLFRVTCRIRADLPKEIDEILSDFASEELVPERHVADFVRSLAMRVDLACRTMIDDLPPPTNCLERCRKISELKRYAM